MVMASVKTRVPMANATRADADCVTRSIVRFEYRSAGMPPNGPPTSCGKKRNANMTPNCVPESLQERQRKPREAEYDEGDGGYDDENPFELFVHMILQNHVA